jgi:hypothetical protein
MLITQLVTKRNVPFPLLHESACPYQAGAVCSASVMTVVLDTPRKAKYCNTEDHDRCPLFLAKVLRGS